MLINSSSEYKQLSFINPTCQSCSAANYVVCDLCNLYSE